METIVTIFKKGGWVILMLLVLFIGNSAISELYKPSNINTTKNTENTIELETQNLPMCSIKIPKGSDIVKKQDHTKNPTIKDIVKKTDIYTITNSDNITVIALDIEFNKNANNPEYDVDGGMAQMASKLKSNLNVKELTTKLYIENTRNMFEGIYKSETDSIRILMYCSLQFPYVGTVTCIAPFSKKITQNDIINSVVFNYPK